MAKPQFHLPDINVRKRGGRVFAAPALRHIFAGMAGQIAADTRAAIRGQGRLGAANPLRAWPSTPVAGTGILPVTAMFRAADMANAYAQTGRQGGVRLEEAHRLLGVLEQARDGLSVATLGKVVGDIELRARNRKRSQPARLYAEALTRACRVLADVCDDGAVPGAAAASAGRRLSTRQAVQSVCS